MALPSEADHRDWSFEDLVRASPDAAPLPAEFDCRPNLPPVRDQGIRPTCGAFASTVVAAVSQEDSKTPLSPEFIYYNRANSPYPGMRGRDCMRIMKDIGVVRESAYRYGTSKKPAAEVYSSATTIKSYARVYSVDGLKRALVEVGPCYLILPQWNDTATFWRSPAVAPTRNGLPAVWHAVAVVAYNEDGFILQNSWGAEWADDGYATFPYSDWPLMIECWAVYPHNNPSPRGELPAAGVVDVNIAVPRGPCCTLL